MTAAAPIEGGLARELADRLRASRERLLATFALTEEELASLGARAPAGPSEDAAAAATEAVLARLEEREQRELAAIDAALARLASGDYGQCEACQADIGPARLRAMPEARYCVACQAREEARR